MDKNGSSGLIIENDHDFPVADLVKAHGIVNSSDWMKVCMNYGFELAKLKSVHDLKNVALLSLLYGYH